MTSKYDRFWEEHRALLHRLLMQAMQRCPGKEDVSSLQHVGKRTGWYGRVEVQDGRIVAGGQAAHARSLGKQLASLSAAHRGVRWQATITSDRMLAVEVVTPQAGAVTPSALSPGSGVALGVPPPASPCNLQEQAKRIHQLVWRLPRRTAAHGFADLPADGIYFFFEQGEWFDGESTAGPRITRVGINEARSAFPGRLRRHFYGNRESSVFRKHLGSALLASRGAPPEVMEAWERGLPEPGGVHFDEVEREVSDILRERFSYAYVPVDGPGERRRMEAWFIGVLATSRPTPSNAWLGRHSPREEIRTSGLWNVDHVGAAGAGDASYLARLEEGAAEYLGAGGGQHGRAGPRRPHHPALLRGQARGPAG